jgi:hypothetical protein
VVLFLGSISFLFSIACSHHKEMLKSSETGAHERGLANEGEAKLIPRDVLYSPGNIMRVRMSPDGKYLASVRPLQHQNKSMYNIYVTSIDTPNEIGEAVLPEPVIRFPMYQWSLRPEKFENVVDWPSGSGNLLM